MPASCHFRGCTVPLQQFVCDSVTLIVVLHFISFTINYAVHVEHKHKMLSLSVGTLSGDALTLDVLCASSTCQNWNCSGNVNSTAVHVIMRPSSLGGGRILRRTLSVRLSVGPVIVTERHVAPPSELQWHTYTFRHAQRAAYRTAISAAQACYLLYCMRVYFSLYAYTIQLKYGMVISVCVAIT